MDLCNIKNNLQFNSLFDFNRHTSYVLDKIDSIKNKLYRIFFSLFPKEPLALPPKRELNLTQEITPSIKKTISQDLHRKLIIYVLANGSKTCFQQTEGKSSEEIRDDLISHIEALEISRQLKDTVISNSHQGAFVNVLLALNDQRQRLQEDLGLRGNPEDFNFMDSPLIGQEITHTINVKENSLKINLKIGFYFARKKEVFFHTTAHCEIDATKNQIDFLANEIEI